VPGIKRDVYIDGFEARNRAFDGDIVALKVGRARRWTR